jgi:hypothetical protein
MQCLNRDRIRGWTEALTNALQIGLANGEALVGKGFVMAT